MMRLRLWGVLFVFLLTTPQVFAQSWLQLIEQGETDFETIRKAGELDYSHESLQTKGTGYKQFKRWEWLAQQQLDDEGKIVSSKHVFEEWMRFEELNKNRTSSFSGNWQPHGPEEWSVMANGYSPGNGRVNTIVFDTAHNNTMYIGTPSGGLWRSYDHGATYECLTDHLPVLGVSSICINPLDSNIIYIGTGDAFAVDNYSIGVLKSTDNGQTWNTTGLNFPVQQMVRMYRLILHPTDTNILVATFNNGVFRTTDGGVNWSQVASFPLQSLIVNPLNPDVMYGALSTVFKSTDKGLTWQLTNKGLPPASTIRRMELAMSKADTGIVYALAAQQGTNGLLGVYKSINALDSFALVCDTPNILHGSQDGSGTTGQGWYDLAIAVHPNNANIVFTGGVNIWRSMDGGNSFQINTHWVFTNQSVPYVHADIHYLGFWFNRLYSGNDGGVHFTPNNGTFWVDRSAGLNITQIYRLSTSATHPEIIHFGAQDNGSMRYIPGQGWHQAFGADGMECVIDYTNPNIGVLSSQNGGLRLSTDGFNTLSTFMQGVDEPSAWVTPFIIHPQNPMEYIVGRRTLWRTKNRGQTWTQISVTEQQFINAVAQCRYEPEIIYYSRANRLWRSDDDGQNWTQVNFTLPNRPISSIAIDPYDGYKVFVTLSGYGANQKVFYSEDGGAIWTNISYNLPNLSANSLVIQEGSPDYAMYLGTEVGVYYIDSTLTEWEPYSDGLPNVRVSELEINYTSGKLVAATYGRGIWKSDLRWFNLGTSKHSSQKNNSPAFPNPFVEEVSINMMHEGFVEVYDLQGRLMDKIQVVEGKNTFNLSGLKSGMYLYTTYSKDGNATGNGKLLKK